MATDQYSGGRVTPKVREILGWYAGAPPGVLVNLARLLGHGRLGGTGKLVILPVDQGVEHGPVRSFAGQPTGYDPRAHLHMAAQAGCSAHAAPLGALEASAAQLAGEVPLILKVNGSDTLAPDGEPCPALTGSVQDALRLGCSAVGFTLYSGSGQRNEMMAQARELIAEARAVGLPTVLWAYPRGGGISKAGQQAVDVVAYAAHLACQLGAHVVKVKPPTAHVEFANNQEVYARQGVALDTLAQRVRHVVQCCFAGRRLVVFSGGESRAEAELLADVRELAEGGAHGSIMGRNVFQRPPDEARALLAKVMDAFDPT